MKLKLNWWWAVAGYMILIFALSSIHNVPQPPVPGIDKPEHYMEYAGLAFLAFLALRGSRKMLSLFGVALVAIAIASAYGATDEFHQRFVVGRTCDVFDWMADTIGAATGALLAAAVSRLRRQTSKI